MRDTKISLIAEAQHYWKLARELRAAKNARRRDLIAELREEIELLFQFTGNETIRRACAGHLQS